MENIWYSIYHSRVIIADLTYQNPNVMYEIVIAHTLGKDTILIYQRGSVNDKFPFDLAHKLIIGLSDAYTKSNTRTTEKSI